MTTEVFFECYTLVVYVQMKTYLKFHWFVFVQEQLISNFIQFLSLTANMKHVSGV